MTEQSLVEATRKLPCSVVIISARAGAERGVMTANAMYVSEVPPIIAISVSKTQTTYDLIEKSKEFAVNIITEKQVPLARQIGSTHGRDVDKFSRFNIGTEPAGHIGAPLVKGCYASIECRVKTSLFDVEGNHAIYIGEVIDFRVNNDLVPVVWLNNKYFSVGAECRL